jgi:FMN phosphatase YigB (HAD superfamily)
LTPGLSPKSPTQILYLFSENAPKFSQPDLTKIQSGPVRVITFDLDNTLWKTSAVISSANDALAAHLETRGIHAPIRVEKIMGTLFKDNKSKYCPVLASDGVPLDKIKAPVCLTQLRKDAILEILTNQTTEQGEEAIPPNIPNNTTNDWRMAQVDEFFDVWTDARHAAIPHNFAKSVLNGLEEIRRMTTPLGERVIVGAITDGNSDPRRVESLQSYFDFCVNAEGVGISKPDRRIYMEAVRYLASEPQFRHVWGESWDPERSEEELLDQLGPWWVHIGDDFIKDIVACKDLNMRSIWVRELVLGKSASIPNKSPSQEATTRRLGEDDADVDALRKRIAEQEVVTMTIGTEDFLVTSIQKEFADVILDEFKDVSKILSQWNNEDHGSCVDVDMKSNTNKTDDVVDISEVFEIIVPDERGISSSSSNATSDPPSTPALETKYCFMCGTKIPKIAKFCSSCGEQQPEQN